MRGNKNGRRNARRVKFITLKERREGQVSVAIGIYTGERASEGERESWHGISIREKGERTTNERTDGRRRPNLRKKREAGMRGGGKRASERASEGGVRVQKEDKGAPLPSPLRSFALLSRERSARACSNYEKRGVSAPRNGKTTHTSLVPTH